jgi:hypothetical protein
MDGKVAAPPEGVPCSIVLPGKAAEHSQRHLNVCIPGLLQTASTCFCESQGTPQLYAAQAKLQPDQSQPHNMQSWKLGAVKHTAAESSESRGSRTTCMTWKVGSKTRSCREQGRGQAPKSVYHLSCRPLKGAQRM